MALPVSTLSESKVVVDIERILPSLPKEKGWWLETLYKYKGFWFDEPLLQGTLITQKTFKAQPNTVVLATLPKSGTTWFAALLFTTMNRTRYSYSSHPLLTSSPHDCVPGIEFYASKNPSNPTMPTTFPLVAAHIPYPLLPESIKSSSCPIIYVCRNPNDVFVSLWHFANKLRPKELQPLNIEEAFDLFCKGVSPFGSYWDHVLGFWKASIEMPNKVLFVRYEDMKNQPFTLLKKLAEFVGCPFTLAEEESGVIEKIIDFCSFESLTSFEVNRVEVERNTLPGANVPNNVFFRKGKVGDHKNYLTDEMMKRLREITEMRFKDSGLLELHIW
ncbi:hypothetical protein BVRB_5g105330 [Beta vulgaris subsp. vulgaris]|nr:hypothetical protein BVRB_5g105330 [Beta vulgaris subsp. vulgaris]